LLYKLAHFILEIILIIFYRRRIYGKENIPKDGPFIICSNHIKWIDPVVVGCAFPRRLKVYFMAKEELFRRRFIAYILKKVGAYPVNRKIADYSAIRRSFQLLSENKVIGLFPEGTRSKTGRLQKAQDGAALIASRDSLPVVPVAIEGPYRIFHPLSVRIGAPFCLEKLEYNSRAEKKALLAQMSGRIMENIKNLLPSGDNIDSE
jgi:1-acyl-sn-glycerol-3-phosphate acyltransferase